MQDSQLELDYAILSYFDKHKRPVGATTLAIELGDQLGLSQATIGRKLMHYDKRGFTVQKGRQGRILTEAGGRQLKEWSRFLQRSNHNRQLLNAIHTQDYDALMDVLITRRALEREAAYLAAERCTDEQAERLRENVARQVDQIGRGHIPSAEDREFHHMIAEFSGNAVLLHALQLVWQESADLPQTGEIRTRVGGKLAVEHERIVEAIVAHDPERAALAMEVHINQIIADVKRYYTEGKLDR